MAHRSKHKTVKLLERNTREKFRDLELGKEFLDMTTKSMKEKNHKRDLSTF